MRTPALLIALLLTASAGAQRHTTTIDVIGVTPIDGIGLDRAKFPTNARRVVVEDGTDAGESLARGVPAVERNDPQGAPLQSDLQFRGFSVSSLLGAPEGLALYQDGVRLNEPFGDTISWTTIPSPAIESIEVIPGANPTFGLNALGGAVALRTRSDAQSSSAFVRGASFGLFSGDFSTGGARWFATAAHLRDGGWRDFSPSDVTQLFGSTRWTSGDLRHLRTLVPHGQRRGAGRAARGGPLGRIHASGRDPQRHDHGHVAPPARLARVVLPRRYRLRAPNAHANVQRRRLAV